MCVAAFILPLIVQFLGFATVVGFAVVEHRNLLA